MEEMSVLLLHFSCKCGIVMLIKSCGFGGDSVAGNKNSGAGIAFRLSDDKLARKIDEFRAEYGQGQHGMVSWPQFCDFIGYSVGEVAECYKRGKEGGWRIFGM